MFLTECVEDWCESNGKDVGRSTERGWQEHAALTLLQERQIITGSPRASAAEAALTVRRCSACGVPDLLGSTPVVPTKRCRQATCLTSKVLHSADGDWG